MNDKRPLISVIVPAYNAETYLAEALQSIIDQDYAPMEIIVVDDGSTDGTAEVAAGFGAEIRYVYQENCGTPAARNKGVSLAQGDIIAFLDSDDLWSDQKLELQLERLTNNPHVGIVLGYTQQVRLVESRDGGQEFVPFLAPQPMLSLGGAVIRKSVFDKVGVFDETFLFCDDIDWFLRAREEDVIFLIHRDVTQLYRKHAQNITIQRQLDLKYQLLAYKKSIDRRRRDHNGPVRTLKKWSDFYETKKKK
ncbi:MAG: glycosyltransferase family 2 protein [Chloroflexi bacterium]|nr:glycosyltransferase family 2 protein [Chloroflexota bacterium]